MPYSLIIIWHERLRYLPAIMAVAFSAVLIALQCGLLLGLFTLMSIPVDRTGADAATAFAAIQAQYAFRGGQGEEGVSDLTVSLPTPSNNNMHNPAGAALQECPRTAPPAWRGLASSSCALSPS